MTTPRATAEEEELAHWEARDPVVRLEAHLRSLGVTDEFFAEVRESADRDAKIARDAILQLPPPEPDSMFAHVYSEEHPRIEEQRAWLARYEASFTDQEGAGA